MKAEFINPFTTAAFHVLGKSIGETGLARGQLSLKADPHISRGISTLVGLSGKLRGHVIYDMDRKTAIKIASIMNGEELPGLDNIVRSTISELANMITGHAAGKLNEAGYVCDITPPTFLVGEASEIYAHKGLSHLILPIETSCGALTVSVALQET